MYDACVLRTDKLEQHWAYQPLVFWQRMVAYKRPWKGVLLLILIWNNYLVNLNGSLLLSTLIVSGLEQLREDLKMLKWSLKDLDSSWIDNISYKELLAVISTLIKAGVKWQQLMSIKFTALSLKHLVSHPTMPVCFPGSYTFGAPEPCWPAAHSPGRQA